MKKMFILTAFTLLSLSTASAQHYSSYATCQAKVPCFTTDYYGRQIITGEASCITFGSSYVYGQGNVSASCTWEAMVGVGVRCNGFVQTRDQFGRIAWGWNSLVKNCTTR